MKRFITAGLIAAVMFMAVPAVSYAALSPAGLTSTQVQAIISLLQSFRADSSVIANVQAALIGSQPITCPQYSLPLCPVGQTAVSPGNDANGCPLSAVCKSVIVTPVAGTLTVSTDASSPAYALVAAGSSNVTVGAYKFHASSEPIALTKIGLKLTSGSPNDLVTARIYDGSTPVGTAVFIGSVATSTLYQPVQVPANADKTLIIKADISSVGVASPAIAGDLVRVDLQGAQGTGSQSGTFINATGSTSVAGVRIVKSYPTVSSVTMNSANPNGANVILQKIAITADAAGPVGIGQMAFSITTAGANAYNFKLFAYTDSGYSQGVASQGGGTGQIGSASCIARGTCPNPSTTVFIASTPVEIPAGATYYFALMGTVAPDAGANNWTVSTTLFGDKTAPSPVLQASSNLQPQNSFVWSPNNRTTSSATDSDWTNGYGVPGLPVNGLSQTSTGGGVTLTTPVINSFAASPSSITSGQSSTLSWNATVSAGGGCYIFANGGSSSITPSDNWGGTGMFTVTPVATTTYQLWCTSSWKDGSPTASKSVTVTVSPVAPAVTLGTYIGYMNGNQFIQNNSISQADALANCQTNASNNPSAAFRCTWNGTEIFNNTKLVRVTCPAYSLPLCLNGTVVSQGNDANGCPLPGVCQIATTTPTTPAAVPAPTCTLNMQITIGQYGPTNTTLSWTSQNAVSASIQSSTLPSASVPVNGSMKSAPGNYTLTVTNATGVTGTCAAQTTVQGLKGQNLMFNSGTTNVASVISAFQALLNAF